MAYKISGMVILKTDSETIPSKNGNLYTKQDLVIAVKRFDPYTGQPSVDNDNTPKFSFFGERCNDLMGINVGDDVIVHFDVNGRKYDRDGKVEYFNDIKPLRIEKANKAFNANTQTPPEMPSPNPISSSHDKAKDEELPF